MSISATTNYMSNDYILGWMETRTEGLYGNMRDAMDVSNRRADAETALNKISSDIANTKNDGADAAAIHDEVNAALAAYGDIPGVTDVLKPIADKLNAAYGTADPVNVAPPASTAAPYTGALTARQGYQSGQTPSSAVVAINSFIHGTQQQAAHNISSGDADAWSKNIGDTVDDLGKKDQLDLINIQELNSEINQAKQTASALMDAADKSANDTISHID